MLYLNDATYYIPDTCLTIEEAGSLLELDKFNVNIYKKIYGIERIPVAKNIHPVDFIRQPIKKLIERNNFNLKKLKYLVHCHTAKTLAPHGSSLIRTVQQQLGLAQTIAFGSSANNCASAAVVMEMLNQVLGEDEQAIIVTADYAFTRTLQVIPNTSILADGAAAILISRQKNGSKLLASATKIVGKYAKGSDLSVEEARDFENSYINLLADIILAAVKKAGLELAQVKLILPHNVNYPSWRKLASQLKIPLTQLYLENIKKYSHCFGADIFINYVSALKNNLLSVGDYFLMTTVGLGATFAAMVFQH